MLKKEKKMISFEVNHYPRNSSLLSQKLKGQMINLAKDTNVPVSGTSTNSGVFGSASVTVGTPAQYISISDYGVEFASEV